MKQQLNLTAIEAYIETVSAYEKDATERRDPLTAFSLNTTQKNLIRLRAEIEQAQEITPEHADKFSSLIDRAEVLNYLGQ